MVRPLRWGVVYKVFADVVAARVQKEQTVKRSCKVKDGIFADWKRLVEESKEPKCCGSWQLFHYACGQVGSAAPPADLPAVSPLTLSCDPQRPDCGVADKRRHIPPCDTPATGRSEG